MAHTEDHNERHVNGEDDIQNATNAQKGLATAAQITALEAATAALTGTAYRVVLRDASGNTTDHASFQYNNGTSGGIRLATAAGAGTKGELQFTSAADADQASVVSDELGNIQIRLDRNATGTITLRTKDSGGIYRTRLQVNSDGTGIKFYADDGTLIATFQNDKDILFAGNILSPTFANTADATKEASFDLSGITTATTRTVTVPDRDVTLGLSQTHHYGTVELDASGVLILPNLASNLYDLANPMMVFVNVDSYTATGDDTLTYIDPGNLPDNSIIIVRSATPSRDITITHTASNSDAIRCAGSTGFVLLSITYSINLQVINSSNNYCVELSRMSP